MGSIGAGATAEGFGVGIAAHRTERTSGRRVDQSVSMETISAMSIIKFGTRKIRLASRMGSILCLLNPIRARSECPGELGGMEWTSRH